MGQMTQPTVYLCTAKLLLELTVPTTQGWLTALVIYTPRWFNHVQRVIYQSTSTCVSSGWKLFLQQSATRRHLSSNTDCFSEPPQNFSLFPDHILRTVFGLVLYTVYSSGLAVLYLSYSK